MNVGIPEAQALSTENHSPTVVSSENSGIEVDRLKDLLYQINHYRKKLHQDIEKIQGHNSEEHQKLLARARELDEREKRLQSDIRQNAESQLAKTSSSEGSDFTSPIEIIIKVKPKGGASIRKSIRCIDKVSKEPSQGLSRNPRTERPLSMPPSQAVEEHPNDVAPKKLANENSKPPLEIEEITQKTEDSSVSTTYRSLPKKISVPLTQDKENGKVHKNLNSDLMQYITRLLGMNVNLKPGLSASVSTITTPGTNTINTTANNTSSNASAPCFDNDRLERLQEFINDNYSFLCEVNDALEDQKNERSSQVNVIWLETLCERKLQSKKPVSKSSSRPTELEGRFPTQFTERQEREETVRQKSKRTVQQESSRTQQQEGSRTQQQESLRTQQQEQVAVRPLLGQGSSHITSRDMVDVTKHLESHILKNLTEYTTNCHKRIDEIAQMMERVRREKQQLIENSLSSGDLGQFTEYREIRLKQSQAVNSANDTKESASQREDPPSEEINNILQKQTRPFGVSKDSGISVLSRPLTSSEFRDSPDVHVLTDEAENTFQPILKDIAKPSNVRLTVDIAPTNDKNTQVLNKEQDEKTQKRAQKPPLSLNRCSPHEPHELSTIAEVETPSASKVNLLLNVESIEPFPSFTAFKKNQQPLKQISLHNVVALDDFGEAIQEITLKSFTGLQEYGLKVDNDGGNESSGSSTSSSSMVDIVKELQRRNIMTEPFKYIESSIVEFRPFLPELSQTRDQADSTKRSQDALELTSFQSSNTLSGIQEIDIQGSSANFEKDISSPSKGTQLPTNVMRPDQEFASDQSSLSSSKSGQPMNLKEFLSRELTDHYRANTNKSSNDSSLSSQFMRSLLNMASKRSSSTSSDRDQLRTSTPVYRNVSNTNLLTDTASISTISAKHRENDNTEHSEL